MTAVCLIAAFLLIAMLATRDPEGPRAVAYVTAACIAVLVALAVAS